MLVLQRVHGGDGCELAWNLCKYDLRKGDLFVLLNAFNSYNHIVKSCMRSALYIKEANS